MRKMNLGVIFGGMSKEHEVSLSSAYGVIKSLEKRKYKIIPIAITKGGSYLVGIKGKKYLEHHRENFGKESAVSLRNSEKLATKKDNEWRLIDLVKSKKVDLFLPILHGPYGEDGKLQGFLEMIGARYAFSRCLAQALGMNKEKTKLIASCAGVPVLDDVKIRKEETGKMKSLLKKISLPLVVKPNELGSSVGISIVKNQSELKWAIDGAFKFGSEVLVEKYVKGREFTVTIIQDQGSARALPIIEIIPLVSEFYDYKAKYQNGGSEHVCPAQIPKNLEKKMQTDAVRVFETVGCRDLARVDFVYDEKKKKAFFIDLNTIPGMTPTSLAPESARVAGLGFSELLDKIIENAMKR